MSTKAVQPTEAQPGRKDQGVNPQSAAPASDTWWGQRRSFRIILLGLAILVPTTAFLYWWPVESARRLVAARNPEAALARLDAWAWVIGNRADAAFLRARAHRKLGHWEEFNSGLAAARAAGCDDRLIEKERLLGAAQSGAMQMAEPHFRRLLLDSGGDEVEVCEAFANGLMLQQRWQSAISLCKPWIDDFPDDPMPHLILGRIAIELQKFTDAEDHFRNAVKRGDVNGEAQLSLASVLHTQTKLDEALEAARRAAEHPSLKAAARVLEAQVLGGMDRIDEAEAILREIVAVDPGDVGAGLELARLLIDQRRGDEAVEVVLPVYKKLPKSPVVRMALGNAYRAARRPEDAREHVEFVAAAQRVMGASQQLLDKVQDNPQDVAPRLKLGQDAFSFGETERGVVWMRSVLDIDPHNREALTALAEHYEALAAHDPKWKDLAVDYRRRARAKGSP
jgi:predicted Zn-dependent protease